VSSKAVQDALKKALELKNTLSVTQRDLAQLQRQLKDITDDQARLRANLKATPESSETFKRYVAKLDKQETEIEQLQEQIKKLQDREHQERKTYEDYLVSLNLE
jgi:septal ring factor EnvC (AmiA/AmiB activator)